MFYLCRTIICITMEDIFKILFFVAFIVISVAGQARKKKQTTKEENWPDIPEDVEEEKEVEVKSTPRCEPEMFIPAPKPTVKKKKHKHNEKKQQEAPVAAAPAPTVPQPRDSVTDLRSPQKAREAFIHSIIFERKYQ